MAVAFQIDEFQTILKKADGRILRSNARPPMSFDYEILTFTEQDKSRFWAGQQYALSPEEITEVQAYIDTVEEDTNLTDQMTVIHQAKKILAATDWYVIRFLETGKPIPDNISSMRELARQNINNAESNI